MIYGVYIVSKSGGLIFNIDHNVPKLEKEKIFNFPLDIKLEYGDPKKVSVSFGQRDGINGDKYFILFYADKMYTLKYLLFLSGTYSYSGQQCIYKRINTTRWTSDKGLS